MMTKQMSTAQIDQIIAQATAAGIASGQATTPAPMVVQQHANPFDDASPVIQSYAPIMSGVCGFAWINVRPGTSRFAKRLVATGQARRDSYMGGVTRSVREFGQSMQMKEAFAYAFAKVLQDNGITAYAGSRMD